MVYLNSEVCHAGALSSSQHQKKTGCLKNHIMQYICFKIQTQKSIKTKVYHLS
jgi:hypothetical protein